MRKKLFSVLLCAAMAVSMLAGCGSKTDTEPTPTPSVEPTPSAKPTQTPVPEPTKAPTVTTAELPDPVYYFSFEDAAGLSPRQNVNDSNLTTVDERVFPVDKEFIFTNGVKGSALWLDGNFGAKVETIKPINTDTYTISFWTWAARLSNYGTALQFGNGMAQGTTEHWLSFTTLDGKTYPTVWNRNAATGLFPNPVYKTDEIYGRKKWAHFCLVVDETEIIDLSGSMVLNAKLYIDGVPSENDIQIVPGIFTDCENEFAFLIGVNPWDTIFKGAIDELYIFDKALTPEQVATLYADGDGSSVPEQSTIPEPEVIKDYTTVAATGKVVGTQDCTSAYGSAYSDIVEVPVGQTVEMKFKNYVGSKLNAEGKNVYSFEDTYSLILQNVASGHSTAEDASYKEYAVISGSEGYKAAAKISSLTVERNTFNQFNPEKYIADTDLATIYLSVTNNGDTANVNIKGVCADGVSRYLDVVSIPVDGPLYFCLTTSGSFIDIQENMAATGLVIGATDFTTPFWSVFSDIKAVPAGETVTTNFKNYNAGAGNNWENFLVVLQNVANGHSAGDNEAYKEYAVLRADNWGWGAGYEGIATPACDWVWETFMQDINGADVTLSVTNNGTTADVVAVVTTKDGKVYNQSYTGVAIDGDLYYCLTLEKAWLDIQGTIVGSEDYTTPFFTAFSDILAVPAGESVNLKFRNFNAGVGNNWENFLVVLQNVANGHSAGDNEAYKEYAVVRADNWGWGAGYEGIATPACDWVWETFMQDINGATVDLTVTNNGTTADIVAVVTTLDGKVYNQSYTGITIDGDLYFCLTLEHAWLNVFK